MRGGNKEGEALGLSEYNFISSQAIWGLLVFKTGIASVNEW